MDRGERIPFADAPVIRPSLSTILIETRKPLLLGTSEEAEKLGSVQIPRRGKKVDKNESYLGVPILSGNKVIGLMTIQSYKQHAFKQEDQRLLTTLANSMSVALENARLFDETQRLLKETEERNAELAVLNSVQAALAAELNIQGIYDAVGDKITEITKSEVVMISGWDVEKEIRSDVYSREKGERFPNSAHSFTPLEKTIVSELKRGKSIVWNEGMEERIKKYDHTHIVVGGLPLSVVVVPLKVSKRNPTTIIAISLQNVSRENAFSPSDVRLIQTLANSMSVALENARLFDETQRLLKETEQRAAELAAISTVSQALVAETELEAMIQLIGSQTRDTFHADIAYVALLDAQTNLIQFPYQHGEAFTTLKLGEGLTSKIIQTGETLLINQDVDKRLEEIGVARVGREALSYLGVPIKSGRDTIGMLSVQSTTEEGVYDNDDLRLLTTIAANAGSAIHTAQLHAETQRRAREMATLAEIGNDIAASRDLEPVLEKIASHAKEILRVRDIAIYLRDGDTLHVPVALGTYTEEIKSQVIEMGQGITGSIAKTGIAELINDPAHDPRVIHVPGTPEDDDAHEAMMVAPLTSRDQVIGVISVWRPHTDNLFSQPDLDFLVSVARQTAIAIESARLYLETQRRAREMSALVDVGRDISASLEAETVLESIVTHAKDLLRTDTSALFLPEGDGKTFRAIAVVGDIAEELRNETIILGEGILGNIALQKTGEIVNDTNADPRSVTIAGTEDIPDEHLMAVPLLANEELKGLMAVWRTGKGKDFVEPELEFLSGLSRQAVIAVQNAQLFADTTETLEQQTATSDILRVIAEFLMTFNRSWP